MRTLLFFTVLILVGCSSSTAIKSSKYEVDANNIQETLAYLASDELKGRNTGTDENIQAANYLANKLKEYNIKPLFKSYNDTLMNIKNSWNVVGVIPGNDTLLKREFVVLGAHYDHMGILPAIDGDSIANGANDDASGVSIVLEIARNLSKHKNKRSVVIAFFTAEEIGLFGSSHLAKKMKSKEINTVLMLNFEMLGVPMKRNYMTYFTGYNKSNVAEKINELAEEKLVGLLSKAEQYKLFERSDNYPFYKQYNIPSHTFSSFDFENFDYYHHVKDEFDQMDLKFMEEFTTKVIPVVDKIINLPQGELKLN